MDPKTDRVAERRAQISVAGDAGGGSKPPPLRVVVDSLITRIEAAKALWLEMEALRAEHLRAFKRPFRLAVIPLYYGGITLLALADTPLNVSALGLLFEHAQLVALWMGIGLAMATLITAHVCGQWIRDRSHAVQRALYAVLISAAIGILGGTYGALADARRAYFATVEATEEDETSEDEVADGMASQLTVPDTGALTLSMFLYLNGAFFVSGIFLSLWRHSCPRALEDTTVEAERLKREYSYLVALSEEQSRSRAESARDAQEIIAARGLWEQRQ